MLSELGAGVPRSGHVEGAPDRDADIGGTAGREEHRQDEPERDAHLNMRSNPRTERALSEA